MIINPFTFLIGRTLALNQGASASAATSDGLIGSLIRPPVVGIVLASAIARSQEASAPPATSAPIITSILPSSSSGGSRVAIQGSNFGPTQGNSAAAFGGTNLTVAAWSPTLLLVQVPSGVAKGNIVVTVGNTQSNPMSFAVTS
jgi:hypothetical protein